MERFLPLLFFFYCSLLNGQNLVPNSGFESYFNCPPYPGQIHEAIAWDSPNNQTTDFFHRCADPAGGASVPANLLGTQEPYRGDGYAGIRTWIPVIEGNPLYREYLSVRLTAPLLAGERYAVRFWVSIAEASSHVSDDIGLYFSAEPVSQQPLYAVEPHIRQPEGRLLEDTGNWIPISGEYTASGGEQYLLIGNFLDDETMTRRMVADREPVVYYYIDEVEVRSCSRLENQEVSIDTTLCPGRTLLLRGTPGAEAYRWNDGTFLPEKWIDAPGAFTVESRFLCFIQKTTFQVSTGDCDCDLDWPNPLFFQPGTVLSLPLPSRILRIEFHLFDAWGRRVSRQTATGTLVLPSLAAGAYFWRAEIQCSNDSGKPLEIQQRGKLIVVTE